MPRTTVLFFRESDGSVPVKAWLETLRRKDRKAFAKCVERIQRLAAYGHELRRPHADLLRDGIHELRARHGNVNYRILYFFCGKNIAVLAHAMTKERRAPVAAIDTAIRRKQALESDPSTHMYEEQERGESQENT